MKNSGKKLLVCCMMGVIAFSLTACGGKEKTVKPQIKIEGESIEEEKNKDGSGTDDKKAPASSEQKVKKKEPEKKPASTEQPSVSANEENKQKPADNTKKPEQVKKKTAK